MSAADIIDDEVPVLETAEEISVPTMDPRLGKQAKRYAKAMAKMGLVPEENIFRISIKKEGALSFGFTNPEVYRFPGSNTFVFFGEFQIEQFGGMPQQKVAPVAAPRAAPKPVEKKPAPVPAADEKEEDATGLNEKEIEMVMSQANATRNQAIKALKDNNGDLVNAIMDLTA